MHSHHLSNYSKRVLPVKCLSGIKNFRRSIRRLALLSNLYLSGFDHIRWLVITHLTVGVYQMHFVAIYLQRRLVVTNLTVWVHLVEFVALFFQCRLVITNLAIRINLIDSFMLNNLLK